MTSYATLLELINYLKALTSFPVVQRQQKLLGRLAYPFIVVEQINTRKVNQNPLRTTEYIEATFLYTFQITAFTLRQGAFPAPSIIEDLSLRLQDYDAMQIGVCKITNPLSFSYIEPEGNEEVLRCSMDIEISKARQLNRQATPVTNITGLIKGVI